MVLQCLPTALHRIVSSVEDNTMCVQVRVHRSRCLVAECGGDNVLRRAVSALAVLADAGGGEGFQLLHRHCHRPFVGRSGYVPPMSLNSYFESLNDEMMGLRDRVRNFIKGQHWLTDGEWKESVLRSILRRNLPSHLAV